MKILFQAYGPEQGGGISNVHLLLNAYSQTFSDDSLLVVGSQGAPLEELTRYSNCQVISYPNGPWKEVRRFWLNYYYLNRLAQEQKVEVIWSLNIGPYRHLGIAQVVSLHNRYQICPVKETRTHPDGRFNVAMLRYFSGRSLCCADGIITQTNMIAQLVQESGFAPPKMAVISKAVEDMTDIQFQLLPEDVVRRIKGGNTKDPFCFLYVATCQSHKNHQTAINAIDHLCANGVDVRLVLTISKEETIHLGGSAAERLIDERRLIPLGWVSKRHLRALYETCDACVMPSILESLSSAHLEAMAWGRAQIVSDLPYAHELCGDAALYALPEDPIDWAKKMRLIIQDGDLRADLIASGGIRMNQFPNSWEDVARKVRQFLCEVIEMKSHSTAQQVGTAALTV